MDNLNVQSDAQISTLKELGGGSFAAKLLANGMDIEKVRQNGTGGLTANANTLTYEELRLVDKAVIDAARPRLTFISDCREAGMIIPINGLEASYYTIDAASDMNDAELAMRAGHKTNRDVTQLTRTNIPLPIIHKDFDLDARMVNETRRMGRPLDLTNVAIASAKVAEKAEELCLVGTTYIIDGNTLYGVYGHTSINSVTLSTYGNWDASAGNGALILACVNAMIQASITDNCYGPWGLYIPTAYASTLNKLIGTSASGVTVGEQLMNLIGFQNGPLAKALKFVRPHAKLTANTICLVPLDPLQVQVIEGLQITVVPWSPDGGLTLSFKVMAIYVPVVRTAADGKTGIVKAA